MVKPNRDAPTANLLAHILGSSKLLSVGKFGISIIDPGAACLVVGGGGAEGAAGLMAYLLAALNTFSRNWTACSCKWTFALIVGFARTKYVNNLFFVRFVYHRPLFTFVWGGGGGDQTFQHLCVERGPPEQTVSKQRRCTRGP